MTIHAVMAESSEIDWQGGNTFYTTSAANYNGTVSRVATGLDKDANQQQRLTWDTDLSEVWVHTRIETNTDVDTNAFLVGQKHLTGTYTDQWRIMGVNSGNLFDIELWDGSSWNQLGASFTIPLGGLIALDVHVLFHATTGIFRVYSDGVIIFEFTGAVQSNDNTTNSVSFTSWDNTNALYLSETIVADTTTVGMSLVSLPPTADSLTVNWTGDYTDVDSYDHVAENSFMTTDTLNAALRFSHAAIPQPYADHAVVAVVVSGVYSISSGGTVTDFQAALTTAATDFNGPSFSIPSTSALTPKQEIWDTNPNTTNAWTIAEVDAMTYGCKPV